MDGHKKIVWCECFGLTPVIAHRPSPITHRPPSFVVIRRSSPVIARRPPIARLSADSSLGSWSNV
jgi:hypothetical protein